MTELANAGSMRRRSVADWVTDALRSAIVTGRFAPGERLSLREVSRQLGVSFIPLREALCSLEAEGLVVAQRGRSAVVAPMTPGDLASILWLRRQIEPVLVSSAAELHTPAGLARVEHQLAACADPGVTVERHREVHHRVHLDLLWPAMTRWDMGVVEMLLYATSRYLCLGPGRAGAWGETIPRERDEHVAVHRELLEVLRVRDADQARMLMRRHLDQVERDAVDH
ncbi:GntR family transcriptional regulator [Pseudonocardia spinosispora]|uniref:GntR family transcriptional regulator n=1 Tax=Pseudonocardia spinosispora TaxID=103441 RepID=UPI00040F3EC4|nr:GntR family transcriptional regulator [Pseudonocardia spinosispora]